MEPLLERRRPDLPFSTARLGSGSDVLGLDDETSRDHDWGTRLTVVVPPEEVDEVDRLLERELPAAFEGLPTRFTTTWDPRVRQRAEVVSAPAFLLDRTGIDVGWPLDLLDWTSLTGQAALEVTAGPVFRDDGGVLADLRTRLAAPPDDLRAWAVASAWRKVEQELPFVGRTADRGDETGSRVVAARLAQTLIRLGFLIERRWSPYAKWLGTAFRDLPGAGAAAPHLARATGADGWREREDALAGAVEVLAARQRETGLPVAEPTTLPFWGRPYRGLGRLAETVADGIVDPAVRRLPFLGPPDLWTDDVGLLTDHVLRRRTTAALLAL